MKFSKTTAVVDYVDPMKVKSENDNTSNKVSSKLELVLF